MFLVPRPAYIVGGPVVSFETVGVAPKEGTGVGLMVTWVGSSVKREDGNGVGDGVMISSDGIGVGDGVMI